MGGRGAGPSCLLPQPRTSGPVLIIFFQFLLIKLQLNRNQECYSQAQWGEFKLASKQMLTNSVDNSLIHHQNSPWYDIYKQAFFILLLRKSAVTSASALRNFVTPCPHALLCVFYLKNEEKNIKNEAFLLSEKEESQTLIRALILSSNTHNESRYLSLHHGRIRESK